MSTVEGHVERPGYRRRVGRALVAVAYLVAITIGVVLAARGPGWEQVGLLLTGPGASWLVLAAVANVVGLLIGLVSWRALLADLGRSVPLSCAARIYYLGFLAKFVPGRVWTLLLQIRLGRAVGIGPGVMSAAFGLSLAVTVFCGLAVGAVVGPAVVDGYVAWLVLPGVLVLAGLIWPRALGRLIAMAARRAGRPLTVPPEAGRGMRIAITTQLLGWLVSGLHLWALAVALGAEPLSALPAAIGGFALAVTIGSLAVFVPDGVGVREVLLVLALAPVLPVHAIGVVLVASRIICLITEVGTAGVVVLLARAAQRRAGSQNGEEEPAWSSSSEWTSAKS